MEIWVFLHGNPLVNSEVAHLSQISSNPLGLGYWAETWRGKKRNLGLLLLSPILELVWVSFNIKEYSMIFPFSCWTSLGYSWIKALIHFILGPTWPKMLK